MTFITISLSAPSEATNLLKIKKSELQLYCDLLTQQSHEMKNLMSAISTTYSTMTAASITSNGDTNEQEDSKTTSSKPTETSTTENIKVKRRHIFDVLFLSKLEAFEPLIQIET